jgi:hypothetical protein
MAESYFIAIPVGFGDFIMYQRALVINDNVSPPLDPAFPNYPPPVSLQACKTSRAAFPMGNYVNTNMPQLFISSIKASLSSLNAD